jgi:hypothetical protein
MGKTNTEIIQEEHSCGTIEEKQSLAWHVSLIIFLVLRLPKLRLFYQV